MNALLTADLHLTDNDTEFYRWDIFGVLEEEAVKNNVAIIGILGDAFDRKDRHTAKLVNKLIAALLNLRSKTQAMIVLLAGNHDAPLKGVSTGSFLITMITSPMLLVPDHFTCMIKSISSCCLSHLIPSRNGKTSLLIELSLYSCTNLSKEY